MVDTIGQLRSIGVHIVLATGRSFHSIRPIVEYIGLSDGLAICSNGTVIVDLATKEPVEVVTFDIGDPVRYFAEHIPDAVLAVEELGSGFRVTGDFPAGDLDGNVTVVDHDDLLDAPATRLVVRWPNGDRERLEQIARASGLTSVDYAIGYSAWLDIMPKGVSKASALARVAQRLGCSAADTVAIGDGHNDVEMLMWARVGVAMGQAPADVKAIADDVCGPVADDGAAIFLARYLPPPDDRDTSLGENDHVK
jgi:HAD superfamily hydrolase (TIGR01484 family)